jgi:tRNA G18 (ribose-2'-O)-methylase SpoU
VSRGYFEIGIFHGKTPANLGTLWRSAYQLGAAGIFTIGRRYRQQASDTYKSWRHVPLREYPDLAAFLAAQPYSCQIVGVEMGGVPLTSFTHPERAIYVLGAEDAGLSAAALTACESVISLPAARTRSFNVAVAGSIVMYDRLVRQ